MTATSTATESQLRKAQAEDSRIAAELATVEAAGTDAIVIGKLRIERELAARRVANAEADHQGAQAADAAAAADHLMDTVVSTLDREDLAVWNALEDLKPVVERIVEVDRQRNATVAALSGQLQSVAGASPNDRYKHPNYGGMSVDGRGLASTSNQVGSMVMGIVADLVSLSNVVLGQQVRTAASVQGRLRQPANATAGGAA